MTILHIRAAIMGILAAWMIRFQVGWREIKRYGLEWQAIFFATGWAGGVIWAKFELGMMGYSLPAIRQTLRICGLD